MSRARKDYERRPGRPPKDGSRAMARFIAAGRLDRRTWYARLREFLADGIADCLGGWERVDFVDRLRIWNVTDHGADLVAVSRRRAKQILAGESTEATDKYIITARRHYDRMLADLGVAAKEAQKLRDVPQSLETYLAARSNGTGHDAAPQNGAQAHPAQADTAAGGDTTKTEDRNDR